LPHHLQTSGVGCLAAVLLVTLTIWIFAGELDGPAVTVVTTVSYTIDPRDRR
jgi:hypothetical protein